MARFPLVSLLVLAGCVSGDVGGLVLPDDDDAVGDDDDASGDDDDAVGDDDDAVGDDDDDTLPPQISAVECGPFVVPTGSQRGQPTRVISGEGRLDTFENFVWTGCSVQRDFDADGWLVCETLWDVQGVVYAWNSTNETAGYELLFTADTRESTCPVPTELLRLQWYYRAQFEWSEPNSTMDLAYNTDAGWVPLATARLVPQGQRNLAFAYASDILTADSSSVR